MNWHFRNFTNTSPHYSTRFFRSGTNTSLNFYWSNLSKNVCINFSKIFSKIVFIFISFCVCFSLNSCCNSNQKWNVRQLISAFLFELCIRVTKLWNIFSNTVSGTIDWLWFWLKIAPAPSVKIIKFANVYLTVQCPKRQMLRPGSFL